MQKPEMITNELYIILGQKRMGKTTLAFELVKNKRYLFLDPRGQLKRNGLLDVNRVSDIPIEDLNKFLNKEIKSLAIHTHFSNYPKLFAILAKMADAQIDLDFWLVVDETQYFSDSHFLDRNLRDLIATGGQAKLNLVFIIREAQEVHKFLRSQSDYIISFRQVEPASLDWSKKLLEGAENELPKLSRLEYVYLRKSPD